MSTKDPGFAEQPESLEELESWKHQVENLPDPRWEKVRALRAAIRKGEYDVDARINEMLGRIENDFGLPCGNENRDCED